MVALQSVAPHVACGAIQAPVIIRKRCVVLRVVVPTVAQGVVRAYDDVCVAAWELDEGELLLVVLCKSRRKFAMDRFVTENVLDSW